MRTPGGVGLRPRLTAVCTGVVALVSALLLWLGWLLWAALLLAVAFRHPPLVDRWEPLDRNRRILASVALGIFVLCFMPAPFLVQ